MNNTITFDRYLESNPQSQYNGWAIRIMCLGKDIVVKNILESAEVLEMKND